MDLQTQTHDHPVDHSEHVYRSRNEKEYTQLREAVEDCLEIFGAPLPSSFQELRIPEMAVVVNQLRLSEAGDVIRRLPLTSRSCFAIYQSLTGAHASANSCLPISRAPFWKDSLLTNAPIYCGR